MAAGTSHFPGNLDTELELLQAGNNLFTKLSAAVNASDSVIYVLSTDYWPNSGAIVLGDSEICFYGGITSNSFVNIVRGVDGTAAVTHASGDDVRQVIVAAYHNTLVSALKATQAKLGKNSSLPSNGKVLVGINGGSEWVSRSYTHTQILASTEWEITHNLGYNPSVTVVDSGDSVVFGNVRYISENKISITFSAAFSGKAYLG